MIPLLLRGVAMVIAVAALIDPVWSAGAPPQRELIAIDLTAGASDRVVAALQASAPRWQIVTRRPSGGRLPCGLDERCVVITDGSADVDVPPDIAALSTVVVPTPGAPNVALRSAVASIGHAAAAGTIAVGVSRAGSVASTDIRVHDGPAIVGSATHKWGDTLAATIEVPWWPIATGGRTLRVEAAPFEGESSVIDNTIDVAVAVATGQSRVLVFDARPSWSSTFVRRAIEDDARFVVEHRARIAPALSAGTPNAALDAGALETIQVVVIGAPDALTAADVALLDRYVSQRGGSLILLPEQRPGGPATRLFGEGWAEQLTPAPQRVGPLYATEILRAERPPVAATVLGWSGSVAPNDVAASPSIVAVPTGHGRVIVSGAMDAWRFRDRGAADFDRFWRSLVAEAAAAGEALRIDFDSALASRGARVPFTVSYRAFDAHPSVEVRVVARCGRAAPAPLRVWPSGALDEFTGELPAGLADQCEVEARAGSRSAIAFVAVADRPHRGIEATLAKLERTTRAKGGVVVDAGKESEIGRALDDSTESSQIISVHPMRSPWWIIPFAGCLSIEWWLRRRAGLR